MLTGKELGKAIESALKIKGVTKTAIATRYHIKPPSVTDWCKRGVISKDKLLDLMEFCADKVGPEHWGLPARSVQQPPATAYIAQFKKPATDPIIQDVTALLEATDSQGRAMALGAVKAALSNHQPAKAKRRK